MMRPSRSLLLLGLLTVQAHLALAADSVVLPEQVFPQLKQILDDAVTQSPRMILRNLDRAAAEGDRIQSRAGLLPSINGAYQVSKTQDTREDIPGRLDTDKIYYNFSLTQPVFHWNERSNNARIGLLRKQIADQQFEEAYRTLALEIRSVYLQLILNKIRVANARNQQQLSDDTLKLAQEKLAQKVTSEGEIFQVQIANDRDHLALEYAELDYQQLKQNFSALTGRPLIGDAAIPDEIAGLPSSLEPVSRLLADFLSRGEPVIAQAQIMQRQIEVETLNYQNAQKRLLPKFNLVAGLNQDQQSYTANIGQKYGLNSRYVGLQANWSIFDGFATRGAIASSLARKRQLEESYRQMKDSLAQDAQRAAKHVELSFRQMLITNRLLVSAQEFLKYRQGDFQRGLASEKDLASAQAEYRNMVAGAGAARYNYLMKLAEFVSLVGADPAVGNAARAAN